MIFGYEWLRELQSRADVQVVPWSTLRDIALGQGLAPTLFYVQDPKTGNYYVTLEISRFWTFLATFSSTHADGVEFTTVYLPQLVSQITAVGMQSFTVVDVPTKSNNYRKSWQYDVPPNATSFYDILVDGLSGPLGILYLRGGKIKVNGPALKGSYLAFSLVDRDDVIGRFGSLGYNRCKLTGLTAITGGTFTVGNTIEGDSSGASAIILAVGSDYLDIRADFTGSFTDAEGLTEKGTGGTATGVTATQGSYVEGDVDELVRNVDGEKLRDNMEEDMTPGGSRKLIVGLYLRFQVYNAHGTDILDLTIILKLARE